MKIDFRIVVLGLVISFGLLTARAWAFPVAVNDKVYFNYALGDATYPGGPFSVFDDTGNKLFDTFCLEKNEYINLGSQYKYTVSGIDDFAARGGVGGASNQRDYLSDATRWLFWQFSAGTLDDYVSGFSFDATWGIVLQKAFWYLEQEITSVEGRALCLVNLANLHQNDEVGGTVKVMNITRNGVYAQSQLIAVATPEPATLFLLGAGMVGLTGLRRRQK